MSRVAQCVWCQAALHSQAWGPTCNNRSGSTKLCCSFQGSANTGAFIVFIYFLGGKQRKKRSREDRLTNPVWGIPSKWPWQWQEILEEMGICHTILMEPRSSSLPTLLRIGGGSGILQARHWARSPMLTHFCFVFVFNSFIVVSSIYDSFLSPLTLTPGPGFTTLLSRTPIWQCLLLCWFNFVLILIVK